MNFIDNVAGRSLREPRRTHEYLRQRSMRQYGHGRNASNPNQEGDFGVDDITQARRPPASTGSDRHHEPAARDPGR